MASKCNAVWVPMKLDAYLNFDPRRAVTTDPRSRAYLAPLTTPNFDGLSLDSNLLQHDIFEQHRNAPYMGCADVYRQISRRQGVYLHWSLPRLYRLGLAGSSGPESVAATATARKYGGFSTANQPFSGNNIGTPLFRSIPERWIIMRTIRPAAVGPSINRIMVRSGTSEIDAPSGLYNQVPGDSPSIRNLFVVESDSVRNISDIPATEDVEVSTSPFVVNASPPSQQGDTFLGRSSRFETWTGNDSSPKPSPTTVTVSRAGNPYFPDYQPQNASVFSFFDDLSVSIGQSQTNYTQASISYTVVGYHTVDKSDPLFVDIAYVKDQTFADRLARCSLDVSGALSAADGAWLSTASGKSTTNMRTLNCGSLYGLPWTQSPSEGSLPNNLIFPGDQVQQQFANSHPVSVGTDPVDALFGWLRSTNDIGDATAEQIRISLRKIQTAAMEGDDDVDSQLMAEDLLNTNNFVPRAAGTVWHFKAPEGIPDDTQPVIPTNAQAQGLRSLNAIQIQLNAILREQVRLQGELFAAWWTYVADRGNPNIDAASLKQRISTNVTELKNKIRANADDTNNGNGLIKTLQSQIDTAKSALGLLQAGIEPSFYTQRDPTLLIAGLSSMWPANWDQDLNVRINPQNFMATIPTGSPSWPPFTPSLFLNKVPTNLAATMATAMSEGLLGDKGVQPFQAQSEYWNNGDHVLQNGSYKNGWFPLFIEWEAEYYHIPFESWGFGPQGPDATIGYGLRAVANPADPAIQADYRIVNGRCPVLPQTGATLAAKLQQVFSKIDPSTIPVDKATLIANTKALDFSSTPMSGLTDQLLTQMQGMHVLPLSWTSNGQLQVTSDAAPVGQEIGLANTADFLLMSGQTDKTPFASLVDMPVDTSRFSPFKPCIHGQFRFTKLNIIDKFGQIVQGIQTYSDLSKPVGPTATPFFPCLGDSYSVEKNADETAKIVLPRTDKNCNFVQLPPSISQDTRVNAMFLKEDAGPQWRQLDEWENPVRGWLIINQANVSFQIFTPDGRFVREYSAANQNPITRPFAVDPTLIATLDPVLQNLLIKFSDSGYLAGLFRSITETTETVQANPSSYGESMASVLGRPLALTVFGMNMELADPPKQNQSTVGPGTAQAPFLLDYNFGLKIGDKDNTKDGLYGYFTAAPDVSKGVQINWNDFYSYHPPDPTMEQPIIDDPSRLIPTDTVLRPFYPDPHATDFASERMQNMLVFAGLVDPFLPVNIYTALLPIRQLKLPQWTIDYGLKEISAFFKMGPYLVPVNDVPAYDPTKLVAEDYRFDDPSAPASNGTITVPSVRLGDWAWLQPYSESGATQYNVMDVTPSASTPQFEKAPYTAVEGFLQMKKPFTKPDAMPT